MSPTNFSPRLNHPTSVARSELFVTGIEGIDQNLKLHNTKEVRNEQ